ncbi:hypothetical protein GCM10016455_12090 [Aliiroseovarius zhejiangensis]|uniref:HNH endonuclease n=1 Tax=Aliiroseovarius zhejiangensis TaxID=1632025 RepID=A0ABQ3IY58_9RHOB|nr:hypothetical protein [Aliiroseovarius zhejiangensis]GHE93493.1 hypothetical protein GCM10016455_12090 [Aliiroseovarius zhejiangensis]
MQRPLQNRVLPTGEIVADPARGMFTGNRGNLPFKDGRLGTSRWKHHHWIICDLTHPKGRYHGPMPARAWTPLFFLDEAVGLAAGHRPCAYCRPDAYRAFKSAWNEARHSTDYHNEIDRALHQSRVDRTRAQIRYTANGASLPDGSFILYNGTPHLVLESHILPFLKDGYGLKLRRPTGPQTVLTPAPIIDVLHAGYTPVLHTTAEKCGNNRNA